MKQSMLFCLIAILGTVFPLGIAVASYQGEIVGSIPWGASDEALGLIYRPEVERVGPFSFSLDTEGNLLISDPVNACIKKFDLQGNFISVVARDVVANHVAVDPQGSLFARCDSGRILTFSGGKKVQEFQVDPEISLIEGYEQGLSILDDTQNSSQPGKWIAFSELSQKQYLVAELVSQGATLKMKAPSSAKTLSGKPEASGIQYQPEWKNKKLGLLRRFSPDGNELKPIEIQTEDRLGVLVFKGSDSEGRLYIETERITPDGYAHLEIRIYSPSGILLDTMELPNLYFTTVYRKTWLRQDASILQMLTQPEGVQFRVWSEQELRGDR